MGVPAFYRWLVDKYPNIVSPAMEHDDDDEPAVDCCYGGGEREGLAGAGAAYDNLYLDMNGIIHPCFHPEDELCPPTTFDEVFMAMFDYMDRLVRIVRPRKLLYLAVDGVAPRAKMNQQRARRYKSAKAAKDAEMEEKLLRERFKAQGKEVLPQEAASECSDPNVITPGTEFMEKLSRALEYYVRSRLNSHPLWKHIKVILSDANVPGEGEHKIMFFIRAQRSMKDYDPNTRHCLCGLDADLIMLALASHEVHFSILREVVLSEKQKQTFIPTTEKSFTSQELEKVKRRGWFPQSTEVLADSKVKLPKTPYQFLNIWVLREYLELDLKIQDPVFKPDIERLIDDFIFICFLAGNDFIPHIPSLETHECAVDLLIEVYKTTFNKMGGYIVNTVKINDKHAAYLKVSRLEKFLHAISMYEEKIFQKRTELTEKEQHRVLRKALENEWRKRNQDDVEETCDGLDYMAMSSTQCSISTLCSESDITENTLELRQKLKEALHNKHDLLKNGACKHDKIKLGQLGYKSRFYREKFNVDTPNEIGKLQTDMAQKYLEGLCWVLKYYFSAVPSWSWYYPFYYAPFASDVKGLSQFKVSFTADKPLKPFDQLMAVLPPESSYTLPKCYNKLIHCKESALQKFYPSEVEIDTVGKRFLWQCTIKLPFIDVELLLSATKTLEQELAIHEKRRNAVHQDKIFMRNSNALANSIAAFVQTSNCSLQKHPIGSATSDIGGWLALDDEDVSSNCIFHSPIKNLDNITNDQTISAKFFNPEVVYPIPRLLDNVRLPDKTVTDESDIVKKPLWHTYPGSWPPPDNGSTQSGHCYSSKPADARWKPSTPATATATAGIKSAGTGWIGRGRGSAAVLETQQAVGGGGGYYGRGRGNALAVAGEPRPRSGVYNYGGGFHGGAAAQLQGRGGVGFDSVNRGAYSFRPGGALAIGGGVQTQQMAWRPVGSWARGGRGGGDGSGGGRR